MSSIRLIIDTDPGTDDILAILLALTQAEVLLFTVTFGNARVRQCLFNLLTLLYNLNNEVLWRKQQGMHVGFDGVTKFRPRVAVGASRALWDKGDAFDYFNGMDGLVDTTTSQPQFNAPDRWIKYFDTSSAVSNITESIPFEPSYEPAYEEILRVLRENEANTITLVALGPLTNFALAAAQDPETFLRAKELVTMGGAVDEPGNVTPVAEFNIFSDPVAAQRVYALSSQLPNTSMPVFPPGLVTGINLTNYDADFLSKQLKITMMSLDITTYHKLTRGTFDAYATPKAAMGSPLAQWLQTFMETLFDKEENPAIGAIGANASIDLHDPLTTWYLLTQNIPGWKASGNSPEDIRPESLGQWTSGMTVADKRGRPRRNTSEPSSSDNGN